MEVKKEFDTYLEGMMSTVVEDKEIEIFIRDLTPGIHKYTVLKVKAIVSKSEKEEEGWDRLWFIYPRGMTHPVPGSIKVVQELDPLAV